ncbi:Arc family DNA-binding protein [Paenirhodobacter sp.]|uniref:Arc family DNA-binding protein n=1 Tax=Paenirhodobacter sp. TaxID=1965326 RepID=UPI003B514BF3
MSDQRSDQGTVQIALRISPDLRDRIRSAASMNNRSVNSELTAALEEKYPDNNAVEILRRSLEEMASVISKSPVKYEMTREISVAVRNIRSLMRQLSGEIIEAQAKSLLKDTPLLRMMQEDGSGEGDGSGDGAGTATGAGDGDGSGRG